MVLHGALQGVARQWPLEWPRKGMTPCCDHVKAMLTEPQDDFNVVKCSDSYCVFVKALSDAKTGCRGAGLAHHWKTNRTA